jgi:4-hydroxybenzoate polyprenyltransferase
MDYGQTVPDALLRQLAEQRARVTLRAYAQLVRLPNVFTAMADIALAALATGALPDHWRTFGLLLLASSCLYCSGMVWNDIFDIEQDRLERPFRPLPSGRIARGSAVRLACLLMGLGVALAGLAGGMEALPFRWAPLSVSGMLAVAILLYDGALKRTWAGPIGMGLCRFLNVMLGLSVTERMGAPWGVHLAAVVGLYIVGVTWFARTEARPSSKPALVGAALFMAHALLLALVVPGRLPPDTSSPLYPYLLVLHGFVVGLPVCQAIAAPKPANVQKAVKRAIMGLVILDAVLATALVGLLGLVILVLLVPAVFLGRWIYST